MATSGTRPVAPLDREGRVVVGSDGAASEAGPMGTRARWDPVRVVALVAAVVPVVVTCAAQLAAGWIPTGDDAVASWRAWSVLSAHPTLLGAPTGAPGVGQHAVYAPGPVVSWLLAVPVHLDPWHGALWGSALLMAAAAVLAVQAGWAAAGRPGAVALAAVVVLLAFSRVDILVNPVWTPWMGAVWLVTTLSAAWAAAAGRHRWWPVVVVAGSIAAQCHVVFVLPALAACAVAGVALWVGRSGSRRWPWFVSGIVAGVLMWLPTVVQQAADRPGNLSLLLHSSAASGQTFGYGQALRGLGAASALSPVWLHRLPAAGATTFLQDVGPVFSAGWQWAVGALVLTAATAVVAARFGRRHLAAAAAVSCAAGMATVATVAAVPASEALRMPYLDVVYWPVGMALWSTLAAAAATVGVRGWQALVRGRGWEPARRRARSGCLRCRLPGAAAVVAGVVAAVVAGGALLVAISAAGMVRSQRSLPDGIATVTEGHQALARFERLAGSRVALPEVVGRGNFVDLDFELFIAYGATVSGQRVALVGTEPPAVAAGAAETLTSSTPRVVIDIGAGPMTAHLVTPHGARPASPAR
jgi:hypothetical protein